MAKGFKHKEVQGKEKVQAAIKDYIKAMAQLQVCVELGLIEPEFVERIEKAAEAKIKEEAINIYKAVTKDLEKTDAISLLLSDLTIN